MKVVLVVCLLLVGLCLSADEPAIVTGHVGQSLEFPSGLSQGIKLEVLQSRLPRSFTFECWFFYPTSDVRGIRPIFSRLKKTDSPHNQFFDFFLYVDRNEDLRFFMGNGEEGFIIFRDPPISFTKDQWHHVSVTIEHTVEGQNLLDATVYLDGEPAQDFAPVPGEKRQLDEQAPVLIGSASNQDPTEHFFFGFMDEIRFWSEALKAADISRFSKQPLSGSEPGLLLYYNMDNENEEQKKSLVDKTINGLHSTLPDGIRKVFRSSPFPIILKAPYNAQFFELVLPGDSRFGPHAFTYVLTKLPANGTFSSSPQESCIINATALSANNSVPLPSNLLYFTSPFKTFPEKPPVISFSYYGIAPMRPVVPQFSGSTSLGSDVVIELTDEDSSCPLCAMCGVF